MFARDFATSKTSDEKTAFAKLLIKQSLELKDDAAEYYVLLEIARDMAVQAGNVELALDAVKRLDAHFAIDAPAMQIEILRTVGKESRSPSRFLALARATMPLIEAAAGNDQYETVSQLGTLAIAAARRARDYELVRRITDRLKIIEQQRKRIGPPPSKPPVVEPVPAEPHPPVAPPPTPGTFVRVSGILTKTLLGHSGSVKSVAFSPDGKTLASIGADGTIRIWNVPAGNQARLITRGELDWNNVAFSPDGKLLASTGGDNDPNVRIWQVADGQLVRTLTHDEKWLKALAFSPNGDTLVAAGASGEVSVWDPATGKARTRLTEHSLWVFSAKFSPDGQRLATAGSGRTIRIWDARTFRHVKSILAHKDRIWSLAFSPDGRVLASSSADKTIRLWDVDSSRELMIIDQPVWIREVAISPDGKLLASAGYDSTVRLWDLPTGKPLVTLKGHTNNNVECVAFSPDSNWLASCGRDNTVRLWQIVRTARSRN